MRLLELLYQILTGIGISLETGNFTDESPNEYVVLTPLSDTFDLYADDLPNVDIQEVRISIFSTTNYLSLKERIIKALFENAIGISERRFIEYEPETQYFHYSIDVMKEFIYEME